MLTLYLHPVHPLGVFLFYPRAADGVTLSFSRLALSEC